MSLVQVEKHTGGRSLLDITLESLNKSVPMFKQTHQEVSEEMVLITSRQHRKAPAMKTLQNLFIVQQVQTVLGFVSKKTKVVFGHS